MSDNKPVFGTVGLYEAMANALNSDEKWLGMANAITYTMIYKYDAPVDKAFFINFDQGKITEVAEIEDQDRPVDFLISGSPDAWKAVIQKTISPTTALATGKLKVKGKQSVLLRHMQKFSYLIDKMTQIDTIYP